jgi:hypothetical protein
MTLPREARDGLMRAWLKVLSERHPDATWVPIEHAVQEPKAPQTSEPVAER